MNIYYRMWLLYKINPIFSIGFNGISLSLFDSSIITTRHEHVTDRVKKVLSLLSLEKTPYYYKLSFNKCIIKDSDNYLAEMKKNYKRIIILNPFGGDTHRSMSINQIIAICNYLEKLKDTLTILFHLSRAINLPTYNHIILNPFPDLENAFNLVRNSNLVITVDTAIVHLASVYDIKQYAIYNNKVTDINIGNEVWRPLSKQAKQLTTSDNLGSSGGDETSKFDVNVLFDHMKADGLWP